MFLQRMKDNLLAEGDYNVLLVDWSCGNEFPYFQAVQKSRTVSDELKDLISFLMVCYFPVLIVVYYSSICTENTYCS